MGAKLSTKQHESKLLSTVLKSLDPKIANETWDEISQAMGSGYTAESVRYASCTASKSPVLPFHDISLPFTVWVLKLVS